MRPALLQHALDWHLQHNHYPPVSLVFKPVAERAIELAADDDWDEMIEMPNGIVLSVGEIVDQLHLLDFIELRD